MLWFQTLAFRTCFKPCEFFFFKIAFLRNYYGNFVILIFIFLLLDLNPWILITVWKLAHLTCSPIFTVFRSSESSWWCVCLIVFTSIRDQAFIYSHSDPIPSAQVVAREIQSRESEAHLLALSSHCSLWLTGAFEFLICHFPGQKLLSAIIFWVSGSSIDWS